MTSGSRDGGRRWGSLGLATLATLSVLAFAAPAFSNGGDPPDERETCPSKDSTVVVQDGYAYRWASTEVRLVSYAFRPGTFPPNPLNYEPTYPQTKFGIDQSYGCLKVPVPPCGQVDTVKLEYLPPGTLTFEAAMAAIRDGMVVPGTALLGTPESCTCPPPPPPSTTTTSTTQLPGGAEPGFTAARGGTTIPPDPCPRPS